MACELEEDHLLDCDDIIAVGGIDPSIYLMNKNQVTLELNTDGSVKDITFASLSGTQRAYIVQGANDAESATSTQNFNEGQVNWTQALVVTYPKVDQGTSNLAKVLAAGRFVAVVKSYALNEPLPGNVQEQRLLLFGRTRGLSTGDPNGAGSTTLGPTPDVRSGSQWTLGSIELEQYVEITPDPAIYTSTTPNAEFLAAIYAGS